MMIMMMMIIIITTATTTAAAATTTTTTTTIAFKGAIRDFLQSPTRTLKWPRAQWCANHVQHIERFSRAACRATCHVVWRDSSAIKFDRVEIAFILAIFYWLNH